MKTSVKKGVGFGITSGVITTVGMVVALYFLSGDKVVITGAILSIAIADSVSDALGIHISEESDKTKDKKHIWGATLWTFFSKFLITISFLFPIFLFQLEVAIYASLLWGYFLLTTISIKIARDRGENIFNTVTEHVLAMSVVIVVIFLTEKILSTFQ